MRRAIRYSTVALIGSAVAIFLAWRQWPSGSRADPGNARLVAEGQVIYAEHCASCHGAYLEGQPNWKERLPNGRLPAPPHDASGHTWHHSDQQLVELTTKGVSGILPGYESDMPAFGSVLSDEQVRAVIAFIKHSWPPEIQARQEQLNRNAQ